MRCLIISRLFFWVGGWLSVFEFLVFDFETGCLNKRVLQGGDRRRVQEFFFLA